MNKAEAKEAFVMASGIMAFCFMVVYIMSYCITHL